MENIKELFLEGEAFEDARQKFNVVLQRLFKSMIDTGSVEGSITLKMDVSMKSEFIQNNDPDIPGETREIKLPEFSYKVNSSITVKDEQKGNNNPQMELVWDDEEQKYVLRYVANTSQRSIFDKDFQEQMKADGSQESINTDPDKKWMNVPQIGGPVADQEEQTGEQEEPVVIDGEYREIGTAVEESNAETDGGEVPEVETPEETPEVTQEEQPEETTGETPKYFSDEEADDYGYEESEE